MAELTANTQERSDQPLPTDWLLEVFVQIANEVPTMSLGVTLSVGGILVSGKLIGGREFMDGVAAEFAAAAESPENAEAIGSPFREFRDKVYGETTSEDRGRPSFIHLKDARFFAPGGAPIPTDRGVFWRGKLAAVDGLTFGVIGRG